MKGVYVQTLNASSERVSRPRVIRLPVKKRCSPALPAQSVIEWPPMSWVETHLLRCAVADHHPAPDTNGSLSRWNSASR